MTSLDSFKCCRTLKVGSKTYAYYSLPVAEKNGLKGISRLPFSLKVLLENMLRNEDGRSVTKEDIQGFAHWLNALDLYLSHPKEIALIGDPAQPEMRALAGAVFMPYLPHKVVLQADDHDSPGGPLLEGKVMQGGKPTAYVCQHYTCQAPVTDPQALARQLLD